ncbi:catechol 1,2-dioxygenase [Mycolicibacterium novocastrense]|uniref:dioxygenase family protein n=1 Tax=Mycolicibacterium novocastrense TaxID=59813 RepID=UPI00074A080B|nr:dioxygenase [Mycolicibacterium novocastrense]KUH69826.1 catechol 1,2-dioxygenase [Mycolicibacterium novocastrense]KUH71375.1 catechol 1,2-dioxygenase [Mycolicibacterium novocastrense]KUH74439.1 catechol 1,2-dioxygenase [Mycolicibacterium novocastrense]
MIIENEVQLTEVVLSESARTKDPRMKEIFQALIRHLHGFVREVRMTEAEFDKAIQIVTSLGQRTTESHNETRLIAGTLGLSALVCLLNNGEGGETTANLLGPFWRPNAPFTRNGDSIVRSPTPGVPLYFTGKVVDQEGRPVEGANIDVWHASPIGLYENQDPDQADWNLRGCFLTDKNGIFSYRSVKPVGYPIPLASVAADLLRAQGRHPMRPAHLHALIYKDGYKTQASEVYSSDDPHIESDAQFGATRALLGHYVLHEREPAPDGSADGPWYSLEHTFVLDKGESRLPPPPITGKSKVRAETGLA